MAVFARNIQKLYEEFKKDDKFVVNRNYQRKLIWTLAEKECLIDSILNKYPIPLILLAENKDGKYEIIDGMQRLNAIFSFIENKFSYKDKYFNLDSYPFAKQKLTDIKAEGQQLSDDDCSSILNYEVPVTIFKEEDDVKTIDVFGRINSKGKKLSVQETRQATEVGNFPKFVRLLAASIRGDSSDVDVMSLSKMPEISIEMPRYNTGNSINANDTFWCRHGILSSTDLRNAIDEEIVADLTASVFLETPLNANLNTLDDIYKETSEIRKSLDQKIEIDSKNKNEKLNLMKATFSLIDDMVQAVNKDNKQKFLKDTVYGGKPNNNPIKQPFIRIFLSLYDLLRQGKTPDDYTNILRALNGLNDRFVTKKHSQTSENRVGDIRITTALIGKYFIEKEPSYLDSGSKLKFDLENYMRRSIVETPRYECKQGILDIVTKTENDNIIDKIIKTATAISNTNRNKDASGYLFIGVADKESDSKLIESQYNISSQKINSRYIVGIDRECTVLKISHDDYFNKIITKIKNAKLSSESFRQALLNNIDMVDYNGMHVIMFQIPFQKEEVLINDKFFIREGNDCKELSASQMIEYIRNHF